MILVYGLLDNQVDHIDGDGHNNAIGNLREVSNMGNAKNQKLNTRNTSGIMGVDFVSSRDKWRVRISLNGVRKTVGLYSDYFEACCIRKSLERSHGYHPNHGQIRNL